MARKKFNPIVNEDALKAAAENYEDVEVDDLDDFVEEDNLPEDDELEEVEEPAIPAAPIIVGGDKENKKPTLDGKKLVRVSTNRKHKCCIGGVWYIFEARKEYNVPANVKEVLRKQNLLYAK